LIQFILRGQCLYSLPTFSTPPGRSWPTRQNSRPPPPYRSHYKTLSRPGPCQAALVPRCGQVTILLSGICGFGLQLQIYSAKSTEADAVGSGVKGRDPRRCDRSKRSDKWRGSTDGVHVFFKSNATGLPLHWSELLRVPCEIFPQRLFPWQAECQIFLISLDRALPAKHAINVLTA
jgi:hypothetical protein